MHVMPEPKMPEQIYCTECGSTDIVYDADCKWDVVKQDFVDFDPVGRSSQFCRICADEVFCEWREVTDVKTLAKIAIHKGDNHDHTSN